MTLLTAIMWSAAVLVLFALTKFAFYLADNDESWSRREYLEELLMPDYEPGITEVSLKQAEDSIMRNNAEYPVHSEYPEPTIVVTAQLTDAVIINGYLVGYVNNDARGRFTDGTLIVTSRIQSKVFDEAPHRLYETENSIYYVLRWHPRPEEFTKLLLNEAVGSYNRSVIYKRM